MLGVIVVKQTLQLRRAILRRGVVHGGPGQAGGADEVGVEPEGPAPAGGVRPPHLEPVVLVARGERVVPVTVLAPDDISPRGIVEAVRARHPGARDGAPEPARDLVRDVRGEREERERPDQPPEATLAAASGCCLLYTSPSPRDQRGSRMPSSA